MVLNTPAYAMYDTTAPATITTTTAARNPYLIHNPRNANNTNTATNTTGFILIPYKT